MAGVRAELVSAGDLFRFIGQLRSLITDTEVLVSRLIKAFSKS